MRTPNEKSKEKFVLAAIEEMKAHGITDFSVRRVADACGVSSGAPYKHFKTKNDLFVEVIRYCSDRWSEVLDSLMDENKNESVRNKIINVSLAYIHFLCDHPGYQSVLMMNDSTMSPEMREEKARMTHTSIGLIKDYCNEVGMDEESKQRKIYAIRSFILGGAFLINAGHIPNTDMAFDIFRNYIEREFDT